MPESRIGNFRHAIFEWCIALFAITFGSSLLPPLKSLFSSVVLLPEVCTFRWLTSILNYNETVHFRALCPNRGKKTDQTNKEMMTSSSFPLSLTDLKICRSWKCASPGPPSASAAIPGRSRSPGTCSADWNPRQTNLKLQSQHI